jgi:hypothetical protein
MTSRDFCYWLQGVFELGDARSFDEVRTQMIRKHLQLVFKHEIDPSAGDAEHQKKLDEIHNPPGRLPPRIPLPDERWGTGGTMDPKDLVVRC